MLKWEIVGSVVAFWYVLTGAFVLVMKAAEMRDAGQLNLFWRVNIAPWLVIGLALDVAFNVVVGWIIFAESPLRAAHALVIALLYISIGWILGMKSPDVELTFSSRVKRHYYGDTKGWRWGVAKWWARQLNTVAKGHI